MSKLVLVPLFLGETLTAWEEPIGDYIDNQEELTDEQNLKMTVGYVGDGFETIARAMTASGRLEWLRDEYGITIEYIAVIDDIHLPFLNDLSTSSPSGSDSARYTFCEVYNKTLKYLSNHIIGEQNLVVIPYTTGQTATAYPDSIGDYVEGQEQITLEQITTLVTNDGTTVIPPNSTIESINENMLDYVSFDCLAVIHKRYIPTLREMSDFALSQYASDTELYEACGNFNEALAQLSVKKLPFIKE